MAKTEVGLSVSIEVKNAQANIAALQKEIEDLKNSLNSLDKESEEYADTLKKVNQKESELTKQTETLNKELKKSADEGKKAGGVFSTLGSTIKTLGVVGAISAAFNIFKDALMKNQKVADTFAAVTGTIASLMTQLIGIITNVISKVSESTNGFDALSKVLKGALTLVFTPLKLAFFAIKLAIEEIQLAWEDSFFGDKDQTKIKELTARINETKDSLKETGKDAVNAGKDIATNFVDAAKSIGQVVSGTIDGVKKIDVGATFEQQKAIVRLKNNAELAAATLAGLIEKYDRQAEQQRQIRDDESKSIEDRIAANNQLGLILEKQRKAQLQQANLILQAAQANLNADKENLQLRKAVIDAATNVAAVEAQITGLQSEQKVNAVALGKIQLELSKQEQAAANQRLLNEQKAAAELIKNENEKLAVKKQIFEEESKIEIERLQSVIDSTNKGTEARIAAEIELENKKSELRIQGQQLDQQILQTSLDTQMSQLAKQKEIYQLDFEARAGFIEQERLLIEEQYNNKLITDEQYIESKRNLTAQENQLEIDKLNQKKAVTDQIIGLFGAETDVGRAALIVKQVLAAQEMLMEAKKTIFFGKTALAESSIAVSKGAAKTASVGFPQNIPLLIGYAVQAAGIIMAIKQAVTGLGAATSGAGAPMPSISAGGGAAPVAPQLPPTASAQLVNAQAINQMGNQATRAYVLNSDIQNNDQRNAYLQRNASIG